tara:strand:+ start:423 stop:1196 length:774 start_codon:yes stop_codon:yes gene_type:complete
MKNIKIEINNNIGTIYINRPSDLNALNLKTLLILKKELSNLIKKNSIKVIILTGMGEKSFIAGADIKEMFAMSKASALKFSKLGQFITQMIELSQKPIIAAINGYALGGGCEFAMACHIRYASDNAIFGQPEVSLGLIPGFGGTQRLPKLIGKGRALEMILTGQIINANEAKKIGLVDKVVKYTELMKVVNNLSERIIRNAPISIKNVLKSTNNIEKKINLALKDESKLFSDLFETLDTKEGMKAFIEKRKPIFKGK